MEAAKAQNWAVEQQEKKNYCKISKTSIRKLFIVKRLFQDRFSLVSDFITYKNRLLRYYTEAGLS
jgi:hypothetical protein